MSDNTTKVTEEKKSVQKRTITIAIGFICGLGLLLITVGIAIASIVAALVFWGIILTSVGLLAGLGQILNEEK